MAENAKRSQKMALNCEIDKKLHEAMVLAKEQKNAPGLGKQVEFAVREYLLKYFAIKV